MSTMTAEQVGCYAKQAGFSGPLLVIMIAVAKFESDFNPAAVNPTQVCSGSECGHATGLWQIVDFPSRLQKYGNLKDPAVNARAAYDIYHGQGSGAWVTWTQAMASAGQYTNAANVPCPTPGPAPVAPNVPPLGFPDIGNAITAATTSLFGVFLYNGIALFGLVIMAAGGWMTGYIFSGRTGQNLASLAKTAIAVVK